jgi:chromosome segregation ATPase
MSEAIKPSDRSRPSVADVLALAGEVGTHLSDARRALGLPSRRPIGPLDGCCPKTIGLLCEDTPRNLPADPRYTMPVSPEDLDDLAGRFTEKVSETEEDIQALTTASRRQEGRMRTLAVRRRQTEKRIKVLEGRLETMRRSFEDRQEGHRREKTSLQTKVSRLEARVKDHRRQLNPAESPDDPKQKQALARKRTEYQQLKAHLDLHRARYHVKQAEMERQATTMDRMSMDLKRLQSGIGILRQEEEKAGADLSRTAAEISRLNNRQEELRQGKESLDKGRSELDNLIELLNFWPREVKELLAGAQKEATVRPPRPLLRENASEESSPDLLSGLGQIADRIQSIEKNITPFFLEVEGFHQAARRIGAELNRETASFEKSLDEPRKRVMEYERQVNALAKEQERLTVRQTELTDNLTRELNAFAALRRQIKRDNKIRSRRRDQTVTAIRAQATRRGALARQADRKRDHLIQLAQSLPRLIGPFPPMDNVLSAAAAHLVRAETKLEAAKERLAQAHDSLADLSPHTVPSDVVAMAAGARRALNRLPLLHPEDDIAARLERQFKTYKISLGRAVRLFKLEKAYLDRKTQLDQATSENRTLSAELNQRTTEMDRLMQKNTGLEKEVRQNREDVERLAGERDRLAEAYEKRKAKLVRLATTKGHLSRAYREEQERLVETARQKTDLENILKQARKNLRSLSHRKSELESHLADRRDELKKIKRERVSLLESLEQGRQDVDRITTEKNQLAESKQRLETLLQAARGKISHLEKQNEHLAADLTAAMNRSGQLQAHLRDEIYPLIQTLALALHRGQVNQSDLTARLNQRETEYEALSAWAAELETGNRAAEIRARNLESQLDGVKSELQEKEHKHLAETEDYRRQLETLENENQDLQNLVRSRGREIQAHRDELQELYPLLSFFVESMPNWLAGSVPADAEAVGAPALQPPNDAAFLAPVLALVQAENQELKKRLDRAEQDRLYLSRDNEHLRKSHRIIKTRLEELLPLLSYFWNAWLKTSLQLAQSEEKRRVSQSRLNTVSARYKSRSNNLASLNIRLSRLEDELVLAREQLEKTGLERDEARKLVKRLKELYRKVKSEAESLQVARVQLDRTVSQQTAAIGSMGKAGKALKLENEKLKSESQAARRLTAALEVKVRDLEKRLQTSKQDGAKALYELQALTRQSHAVISGLKKELSDQKTLTERLTGDLEAANRKTKKLEEAQDRLALLFWIISKYGGGNDQVYEALIELTRDKGFRDAADITAARMQELGAAAIAHMRTERFRGMARRAIGRGLTTLLVTGGLVFAAPSVSSVATKIPAELTRPQAITEILNEEPAPIGITSGPVFSNYLERPFDIGFIKPSEKAKGYEHVQTLITDEVNNLARQAGLSSEQYLALVRGLFKPGQTVSLERLKDRRAAIFLMEPHFPKITAEFGQIGIDPQTIGTLYRMAIGTSMGECMFWDRLYADFRALGAKPEDSLSMILNNAKFHADTRASRQLPEFAGRLKPIPELESLSQAGFTRVITPYFKANIKAFISHPAFSYAHEPEQVGEYAQQLANDMYTACEAFGVPKTLLISITHQESYFANVLGDNSLSASPFQIYRPTKPLIIKHMGENGLMVPKVPTRLQDHLTLATYMAAFYVSQLMEDSTHSWKKGKPPLCDLDQVALSYNGGEAYPPAVYRKKLRLMGYLDRIRKVAGQTREQPRG